MRDWHALVARNVLCPLLAWKDGHGYTKYLTEFERTQYLSLPEIRQLQFTQITDILSHAFNHCRYYRAKYQEAGVDPTKLTSLSEFTSIPLLTKQEIQQHADEMVADNVKSSHIIKNFTGGSTGQPLGLFLDKDRQASRLAGMIRHNRWAGVDVGEKLACLWGAVRDVPQLRSWLQKLRNLLADRLLFLDAAEINAKTMEDFLRRLAAFRPRHLLGYANLLTLFARYVKTQNRIGEIQFDSIISSAEVLTKQDRITIEEAFGGKVFDRYGCREASVLASECECHEGLHINAESVYLEFLPRDAALIDGQGGEIVVTDLRNRAMPLIRYRIGDFGVPTDRVCRCGRGLPLMDMAAGRVSDFLVTADGRLVSGIVLATYLITRVPGVSQIQFRQERRNLVTARVVAGPACTAVCESPLRELSAEFFGQETRLDIEFVESIPREKSGKFRFTVSSLDPMESIV